MKKNKILKTLIVVAMLLCTVAILFACSPNDLDYNDPNNNSGGGNNTNTNNPDIPAITITFMDGDEVIKESTVLKDALEFVPEKEGFVFDGWYLDEDFSEEVTEKPTESVTLYAKWSVATFTVRFLDGEGQPILVNGKPTQTVTYGESAIAPEAPEMEGYEFIGWNMDFSEVKSDLTIRARYETEKMSIILYGEDGSVIKTEKVMVGENIDLVYSGMIESAKAAIPGGLNFVGLYTDSELENEYQIPSGEHVMPAKDIHLYTKIAMQNIVGLSLKALRGDKQMANNAYDYDTKGFEIARVLDADNSDSVITYSYEWYDVKSNTIISGQNGPLLTLDARDVGEYSFEIRVTATYKDLTPVSTTDSITVKINKGTLEGLVSVKSLANVTGFEDIYNGAERPLDFNGLLPGDVISYRLKGDTEYTSASPIKNARVYESVESKIERKNYNPYELEGVKVTITPKKLTPRIWLEIRSEGQLQTGKPYYELEYGSGAVSVIYEFDGFVGEDNVDNAFDNLPAQINDYAPGSPVGDYYLNINTENCYVNGGEHPQNYTFAKVTSPLGSGKDIILKINKKKLSLTLQDVTLTYGDVRPNSFEVAISNAFASDEDKIRNSVNELIDCLYVKGSSVGEYAIDVSGTQVASALNDSYLVTVTPATLTVNKAKATITAKNVAVTYGDLKPGIAGATTSFSYEVTGLVNGEKEDVLGNPQYVCSYEEGSPVKSSGYVIDFNRKTSFIANGSKNYDLTFVTGTLTVNRKNVTLTLADKSIIYYDEFPANDVFYQLLSVDGIIAGDTLDSICTDAGFSFSAEEYNAGSSVGDYKVSVGYATSPNYIINQGKGTTGTLKVTPRALTISVVESEVVYGNAVDIKVNYDGLVGKEYFDPSLAVSGGEIVGGYNVGDNVGEYTIEIGNFVSENYAISYVSGKITVVERDLTLRIRAYTPDEIVWSGSLTATDGSVAYAGNGIYEEDAISGIVKTTASTQDAYIAKGNGLGDKFVWEQEIGIERDGVNKIDNYNITYDFQVAIATYGVFVQANEVYYDGATHGLDVEYILAIATVIYSTDGINYSEEPITSLDAGQTLVYYGFRIANAMGELYDVVKNKNDEPFKNTITINPRPISIVADSKAITYGEATPELTITVTGYDANENIYANGESLDNLGAYTIDLVDFSVNAGRYVIDVNGFDNDNYAITIVDGELTINQAPLTVTAGSFSITYGDAIPTFTATCEGFVNGESLESLNTQVLLSSSYTTEANRKSGNFAIVPNLSLKNYDVTAINGNLAVSKMAITLSAENKNVTFGDATPTLTAKANKLGYNDTVNDIGTISLTTAYVSGNNVGNYVIELNATSEKYTITEVDGKVIVSPYKAIVTWEGVATTYTYTGTDYTDEISASYVDFYGAPKDATVSFKSKNANSTTPNTFKNAADYTTTASTSDSNYKLINEDGKDAVKTLTIEKATYSGITHDAFNGRVYNKDLNLESGFELDDNFSWVNGITVPTVDVVSYPAIYNADSENYKNFELNISIELSPAIVSIQTSDSITGSVTDGYVVVASINPTATTGVAQTMTFVPTIYWNDGGVTIDGGFTLQYSNNNVFQAGTHLTTVTFTSVNYKFNETVEGSTQTNIDFYVKFQSVLVGSTYYTPEDAIKNTSSGNMLVKSNTTFAYQKKVVEKLYNDASYYTIQSGATFTIPYSATDEVGYLGGGEDGSTAYSAHPEKNTSNTIARYILVTLPYNELYDLNVNGKMVVGALTGSRETGVRQNGITGGYSEIDLGDRLLVNGGSELMTFGYIKGTGEIVTSGNATLTENMYLIGWPGGSQAAGLYLSNGKSVNALTLVLGGTISESNPNTFPIKQYELRSNQVRTTINYGASLRGYIKIATSKQAEGVVKARITQAYMSIISSSTDASSGLLRLTSGANIVKSFANDRVKMEMNGAVNDGYLTLTMTVGNAKIVMSSEKVFFGLDGRTDIVINNGATFTQGYKFKFLPGSTLTVNNGGNYVLNGSTVMYPGSYSDLVTFEAGGTRTFPIPYPAGRGDAKLFNGGTITVNGALGGEVLGINGGIVTVGASATTIGVKSIEGGGYLVQGTTSATNYFVEGNSVVRDLVLGSASVSQGTTYTYTNGSWA